MHDAVNNLSRLDRPTLLTGKPSSHASVSSSVSAIPGAPPVISENSAISADRVYPDCRSRIRLGDFRFRSLLAAKDWYSLPLAVRRRFSKRYEDARTITYTGKITICRMSLFGKLLAHALRPIGAPLPTSCDVDVPAVVAVTEDEKAGGQIWTRVYGRHDRFPQVVQSSKRFHGKTGIEEYIGYGIGMALSIRVCNGALDFCSDHYYLSLAGFRWRVPRWLSPGALLVRHRDIGNGLFDFVLHLEHPLLGELIYQKARFSDSR